MSLHGAWNTRCFEVVAIASSTGGPPVVEGLLASLPADLSVPILIGQHLPPAFTKTFAAALDKVGALTVVEAEDGMPLLPGSAYLGRGRQHLRVRRNRLGRAEVEVSPEPSGYPYKPSANELFSSCARVFGAATLAVVLTGLGRDGEIGARAVKAAGGVVVTQHASTCVIYGMPKACVESGLSDAQLTPAEIAAALLRLSPGAAVAGHL